MRRHQGHLNLYRVYAGQETFGSLRDDLADLKHLPDGAQLTWPASGKRPVAVTASWRLTGPAQIDLELKRKTKIFLYHGTDDRVLPVSLSEKTYEEFGEKKLDYSFEKEEGLEHSLSMAEI